MGKYNIYIICKNEEIFLKKSEDFKHMKSKICHIQWVPAEYLKLTQCNKKLLKKLNTRHNTKDKSIIAKLGCIAAHRKALLAIYSNQTDNNLILEEDATFSHKLPIAPKDSCYFGGWIIPPQITKAGKVKLNIYPNKGLNQIDYQKFKVLTTHSLFIKTHEEAIELLDTLVKPDSLKNYDVQLADNEWFKFYQYPPVFVQSDHKSEIDDAKNKNYLRTQNYGL